MFEPPREGPDNMLPDVVPPEDQKEADSPEIKIKRFERPVPEDVQEAFRETMAEEVEQGGFIDPEHLFAIRNRDSEYTPTKTTLRTYYYFERQTKKRNESIDFHESTSLSLARGKGLANDARITWHNQRTKGVLAQLAVNPSEEEDLGIKLEYQPSGDAGPSLYLLWTDNGSAVQFQFMPGHRELRAGDEAYYSHVNTVDYDIWRLMDNLQAGKQVISENDEAEYDPESGLVHFTHKDAGEIVDSISVPQRLTADNKHAVFDLLLPQELLNDPRNPDQSLDIWRRTDINHQLLPALHVSWQ